MYFEAGEARERKVYQKRLDLGVGTAEPQSLCFIPTRKTARRSQVGCSLTRSVESLFGRGIRRPPWPRPFRGGSSRGTEGRRRASSWWRRSLGQRCVPSGWRSPLRVSGGRRIAPLPAWQQIAGAKPRRHNRAKQKTAVTAGEARRPPPAASHSETEGVVGHALLVAGRSAPRSGPLGGGVPFARHGRSHLPCTGIQAAVVERRRLAARRGPPAS